MNILIYIVYTYAMHFLNLASKPDVKVYAFRSAVHDTSCAPGFCKNKRRK